MGRPLFWNNSFFHWNRVEWLIYENFCIFAFQFFRYGNHVMILNIETVLNFYK